VTGAGARAWRLAGVLCGLVVAIDQAAKALVEARLAPAQQVDVLGPLRLTLAHNSGAAFGLAGNGGGALVVFGLIALCLVAVLFARNPTKPGIWIAAGLLAGGALGNLADRVRSGAVVDYIEVGPWPPFNFADVAITAGVAMLAIVFLREAAD
jgi:signal peptidase II